jgi:predicted amidophosphoribosyltransferase
LKLQSAVRLLYPPQCVSCGALTDSDFGLCGDCWRDTAFIGGLVCDACGTPLPGEDDGTAVHCDDCMTIARPWTRGRAAFVYKDNGRKMVLGIKHSDRTDLARAAGGWMATAAAPLLHPDTVLVPVPLHWTRLLSRRYNQSALLAHWVASAVKRPVCPDALIRKTRTKPLEGHSRDARFAALQGSIAPHPGRIDRVKNRPILLIDDVMTSGATLAACTEALSAAGAGPVCVLLLARVAKDA